MERAARTGAWAKNCIEPVPIPYERLEWIESNGNQYCKLGFPFSYMKVDITVEVTQEGSSDEFLVGSYDRGVYFLSGRLGSPGFVTTPKNAKVGSRYRFFMDDEKVGYVYEDGVLLNTANNASFLNQSNTMVFIFAGAETRSMTTGPYGKKAGRIIELKTEITETSTAGRSTHFVPVLDDAGIPCLFDVIDMETKLYNLGSGMFGYKKLDGTVVQPL